MNLLVHDSALGDWILTWPILRALARQAPTWAVTSWPKARLAASQIPDVVPVDGGQPGWSRLFAPEAHHAVDEELSEALRAARAIVSFVSRGDDAWAENLRTLAPEARLVFVPPRPPRDWEGHVTTWHRKCLSEQGLALPHEPVPLAGNASGPIVVHPGSGGAIKRWPRERFETLIRRLRQQELPVTPVLGEVEWQQWGDVALRHWRDELEAVVVASLPALAEHVAGARLYIGNDSGPTHLSAQLGVPTVALFGPTAPDRWAPMGPAVTPVAPEAPGPMTWLSVEELLRQLPLD